MGDVVGGVEPHKIQQRKRAHGVAASQLHGLIDIFNRAHAFFIGAHRVQQVGHQQPVYDEAALVAGTHRHLAHALAKIVGSFVDLVGGGDSAYHLHQHHEGNGSEKVQ